MICEQNSYSIYWTDVLTCKCKCTGVHHTYPYTKHHTILICIQQSCCYHSIIDTYHIHHMVTTCSNNPLFVWKITLTNLFMSYITSPIWAKWLHHTKNYERKERWLQLSDLEIQSLFYVCNKIANYGSTFVFLLK